MVFRLSEELVFPDPHFGEMDGLLAIGGDLSTERLLLAYRHGIFPWYAYKMSSVPRWYCPMNRFVIFPNEIHVSHSMHTLMNKGKYHVTFNKNFEDVIKACSKNQNRDRDEYSWLGEEIIKAYIKLHELGFGMSVETWDGRTLVGGLYGVCMGNCFMGESMFSEVSNGSKLALISLAKALQLNPGTLIDCQFETTHLKSMGGRYIPYDEFMKIMESGLKT